MKAQLSKLTELLTARPQPTDADQRPASSEPTEARPVGVVATQVTTRTRTVTETETVETKLEFLPWDGPEPSCIVVTTAQIAAAFEENPLLREYASMHHEDMTNPEKVPDYIVELFIDLIRRGHEAPRARNIRLNLSRTDQVLIRPRSGVWELYGLPAISRTLLDRIAQKMRHVTLRDDERDQLPTDTQEALAWARLHYMAESAKYARAVQKPLAAHLANMARRTDDASEAK